MAIDHFDLYLEHTAESEYEWDRRLSRRRDDPYNPRNRLTAENVVEAARDSRRGRERIFGRR